MDIRHGVLHSVTAADHGVAVDSPELRRLAEARNALEHARRQPRRQRRCAELESAEHAVQVAAVAAHNAGVGWTQIGDALGITRAKTASNGTQTAAPAPAAHATDGLAGRHHQDELRAVRVTPIRSELPEANSA